MHKSIQMMIDTFLAFRTRMRGWAGQKVLDEKSKFFFGFLRCHTYTRWGKTRLLEELQPFPVRIWSVLRGSTAYNLR